ncbi:MAG: hypothetical protein AAF571_11920 [Verrucomicrobiota bacterium]
MATTESPQKRSKTGVGGASKMATSMAFIVSVVVHLVIFLFVGSVVIFEGAIPPNLFTSMGGDMLAEDSTEEMELPPLMEEELQPEPLETPMDNLELDTEVDLTDAMSSSDLIIANTTAPALTPSLTKPLLSVGTDTGTRIVTRTNTTNRGNSRGPGTPRTANIFGRTVSAAKFGAILDISFSTHDTIDTAINEIQSGFPDSILVLAPGCGMTSDDKGEVVPGKKFEKNMDDYEYEGKDGANELHMLKFFQALRNKNKNFAKLWDRAVKDDRGYLVALELPKKGKENNKGELQVFSVTGSNYAFDFLIDQGCDVIYWMADFNDGLNQNTINDVLKNLKRNDVKVIQHDFDGQTSDDQKNRPTLKKMVDETEGQAIFGRN